MESVASTRPGVQSNRREWLHSSHGQLRSNKELPISAAGRHGCAGLRRAGANNTLKGAYNKSRFRGQGEEDDH